MATFRKNIINDTSDSCCWNKKLHNQIFDNLFIIQLGKCFCNILLAGRIAWPVVTNRMERVNNQHVAITSPRYARSSVIVTVSKPLGFLPARHCRPTYMFVWQTTVCTLVIENNRWKKSESVGNKSGWTRHGKREKFGWQKGGMLTKKTVT